MRLGSFYARPVYGLPTVIRGKPLGIGSVGDGAVGMHARGRAARRQTKCVNTHRHATGMGMSYLDMQINNHRRAHEPHRPHADVVAEIHQLEFQIGDLGIWIAVAHNAKTGCLFAQAACRYLLSRRVQRLR